jgi:nucleotide-binding universal stress UspA family protein
MMKGERRDLAMLMHTIVVGFDGSADARRALEVAGDHCGEDGVVHVVTAYHQLSTTEHDALMASMPDEYKNVFDPSVTWRDFLHDAEAYLTARGVSHRGHLVADDPASAILNVADQTHADLIVVGSRGLGRMKRFLRGSVSARLANHAKVSLMILHDDAQAAAA